MRQKAGPQSGTDQGRGDDREVEADLQADSVLVRRAHETAMADGGNTAKAWRAAVGAYLQRHPGIGLFTAERAVTILMRPTDTAFR